MAICAVGVFLVNRATRARPAPVAAVAPPIDGL
jgi:hypothetical protein